MIYCITNTITGDRYIGATQKRMGERFKLHRRSARKQQSPLARALFWEGYKNFTIQHIATALDINYLTELETLVIIQEGPEYNVSVPYPHPSWRHRYTL